MKDDFNETDAEELTQEELKKIKEKIIHNPDEIKFKFYDKFRKKITERLKKFAGDKRAKGFEYIFALPDFFMMLVRLMFDDRVDKTEKAFISGIVAYLIMPFDIIPDFIPVFGYIDDMMLIAFGLDSLLKHVERQVFIDNWSGEGDVFVLIEKIIHKTSEFLNKNIIEKIKTILENLKK
jgi:uncharacterized membrane protein YkvA (DUF1232 family)